METAYNLEGAIGGAVVDDPDFVRLSGKLTRDSLQLREQLRQRLRFVVCRYNHGKAAARSVPLCHGQGLRRFDSFECLAESVLDDRPLLRRPGIENSPILDERRGGIKAQQESLERIARELQR